MLKHCYRYCNKYGIPCEAVKCEFVTLQEHFKKENEMEKKYAIKLLEDFIKYFEAEAVQRKYRRNISITVGEDEIEAIETLIKEVKRSD